MALTFRPVRIITIEAVSGEIVVGRVHKLVMHGIHETRWTWSLCVQGPETKVPSGGHADTVDEAKAALAKNWEAWCVLAGLRE